MQHCFSLRLKVICKSMTQREATFADGLQAVSRSSKRKETTQKGEKVDNSEKHCPDVAPTDDSLCSG